MMMSVKPFNARRAIIALIVALVCFLLYCLFGYLFVNNRTTSRGVTFSMAFNYKHLLCIVVLVADILIYWWLRNKFIHRRYANIHIWSVIVQMIVVPLFSGLAVMLIITHTIHAESIYGGITVILAFIVSCFLFFIIGHVFLILVILKRNQWPSQLTASANDQLQEFDKDAY